MGAQHTETANVLSRFVSMYTIVTAVGAILSGYLSPKIGYGPTILIGACVIFIAPIMRMWVNAPSHTSDRLFRKPSKRILAMSAYSLVFAASIGLVNPFLTLILKNSFGFKDKVFALEWMQKSRPVT